MLSLFIQLLILFAILPVFGTFLSTGAVSILTPALNEFVPLGVVDQSKNSQILMTALEENNKIELIALQSLDTKALENGRLAGILLIPAEYDESFNRVLEIQLITHASNLKVGAVYDAVFPSIVDASAELTSRRKDSFGVSIVDPIKIEKKFSRPLFVEGGEDRFSSFFLTYLVPLMLFFPIFTVGSVILDSVVGERERKTVESVIASPIKRHELVISKFLAASAFVFIQLLIWFFVLGLYGVPFQNTSVLVLLIMAVNFAIIATALLFAYYSSTVKEANILLMLLYTMLFIGIIVSLSINYFDISRVSTPFTNISDLLIGGGSTPLFWLAFLILYTLLVTATNIQLIERDDIVFGPRPGFYTLLADLSLWLFSSGKAGYIYLTFVFGIFAILYATFVEIALGIFVIFALGFSNLVVFLFALVEELIKPVGIYLLASKKQLKKSEGLILGLLSGIMFFALESAIFALATYYLFPTRLLAILRLRLTTTLVIHGITSGIVGYGIIERKNFIFYLLLATLIHALFNLVVTGVIL
jgi:ABC-2 type transport system permease protein